VKKMWRAIRFLFMGWAQERKLPRIKIMDKSRWKHFEEKEVAGLDYDFVCVLDRARDIAKIPFIITSGLRPDDPGNHGKAIAVDLRNENSRSRFLIIKALISVGMTRLGVYIQPIKCGHCGEKIKEDQIKPGHIHVDDNLSGDQNVMWFGFSK